VMSCDLSTDAAYSVPRRGQQKFMTFSLALCTQYSQLSLF
jgi:hypothetical protein